MSSSFVRYVLKSEEIDTVLHFAAQSHVGRESFFPFNPR